MSKNYKGTIDVEVPQKIREFQKKIEGTKLEKGHSFDKYHVVAPLSTFILKKDEDPLLFYPIGDGLYYLVHKWGTDMNAFRSIAFFPIRTLFHELITFLIIFSTPWFIFLTKIEELGFWSFPLSLIAGFISILLFILICMIFDVNLSFLPESSDEYWDENLTRK